MYKVVDLFNGWESKLRHSTFEGAKTELALDREEFHDNMINRDCLYMKEIVPANAEYKWDGREYCWQ
jgi:hypothetical protein